MDCITVSSNSTERQGIWDAPKAISRHLSWARSDSSKQPVSPWPNMSETATRQPTEPTQFAGAIRCSHLQASQGALNDLRRRKYSDLWIEEEELCHWPSARCGVLS